MPEVERIQQNTPGTASKQWLEAGAPVDPGTVTVGVTRADGTVLLAPGTATAGATTNPRTFNLTAVNTLTSYVEVVGGFLFNTLDARAAAPLNDTTKYPQARLEAMRIRVEQALEEACGVAFVPRYERERITEHTPWRTHDLQLRWPKVRAIRDATLNGTALTSTELAEVVPAGSFFYYSAGWGASGRSDIWVGYEHGYDFTPARVSQAAILLAKAWLVAGPIGDRTTSMSTEDGTFTLATPGLRGSTFGIPEVDAVVEQYGFPVFA
jgi:hypothetical protein